MKKYLFLICLLFPLSLKAETFVDALGAECSRVLYNMRETSYPERFDNELKRNMNFSHIEKCLETYKNNGGNIEKLNEKFSFAMILTKAFFSGCLKEAYKKENNDTKKATERCNIVKAEIFSNTMIGEECMFYMKDVDPFYLNDLLEPFCKTTEK